MIFESDQPMIAGDLIADVFSDAGIEGVCIEDPDSVMEAQHPLDRKFKGHAFHAVSGYWPVNDQADKRRADLERSLSELEKKCRMFTRVVYRTLAEEDWAESWKTHFFPERITPRIVVKPTWREYAPKEQDIVIEIDPGMAFGTGTHPTTSLCIEMLEKYIRAGDAFLDVGTGSGILMIAASKLGASSALGIDVDDTAVAVASRNLELNRINPSQYKVMQGNLVDGLDGRFTLVAANILSKTIMALLEDVRSVISSGTILIFSGITEENAATVIQKIKQQGFKIIDTASKEEWTVLVATS